MRFVAPTVAALLVGGMVVPVAPAAAAPAAVAPAPATTTQVDDSDLDSWAYTDGWIHAAGEGWTAQNFQGSESFSNTAGARATLTFSGTAIDLVGTLGPNAGRARVWVDCGEPIILDMYAPAKRYGLTVATFPGLPAGTHTLTMEVLGTRNGASTDTYGILDYARIVDDPALADPSKRWQGAAPSHTDDPVELRRAGCGSQSELVSQLKLRSTGGWFDTGDSWGAVNGHSAELGNGRAAPGPVILASTVREAATLGSFSGEATTLDVDLPDSPRSMLLWVAADETVGGALDVAVANRDDGMFLPARVLEGTPGEWTSATSTTTAVALAPGEQKVLVVDLAGVDGVPDVGEVSVWASSTGLNSAELVILQGRVSDLSAARLAAEVTGSTQPNASGMAAPAAAFSRGPVVLSRVLADAAQPAWTPDGKPVDLFFGRSLTVAGERQSSDAMSITLPPAAWPNSTSTVQVTFETGQRCRSLTASVGIDDSTAARSGATVSVSVLGDGEPLAMKHNGLWASVDFPGVSRSPVTDGEIREDLAEELRGAKTAAVGGSSPAITALIDAQAKALGSTGNNRSMAVTSYPIPNPLVVGTGFNGNRSGARFAPADLEPIDPRGTLRQQVDATALDALDSYPFSVDLMTDRMRQHMRTVATSTLTDIAHVASPLVRSVVLQISGTPGAVVAVDHAELDCVSVDSGPQRVMPLWSQIGLPPVFLPSPAGADGTALWQLGTHPLWWDLACPAGPSGEGLHYTAKRTRLTSYTNAMSGVDVGAIDVVRVDEVSTASLPACALPADQKESAFSEWELAAGSDSAPDDDSYAPAFTHTVDPTKDRVKIATGDWTDQLRIWAADAGWETLEDPLTFAIWAALAPFDLPVAIVLNPFVQHALPVSAQLAVGGVLHGGAELVAKLPAASEAGAKLTFVTAEQAQADAAAGRVALFERDGADLAIPLADGKADLALEQRAVVVGTDRVSAGIPSTKWGPGWVDETLEAGQICTRDIGNNCRPRRIFVSYPGPDWVGEIDEEGWALEDAPEFPEEGELPVAGEPAPEPPTEAHVGQAANVPPPSGFEAMFPTNPSRSVVGAPEWLGLSDDPQVQTAWQTTVAFAQEMGAVQAEDIAMQMFGAERVHTLALRTSNEPLYFYSTLPPSVVIGTEGELGAGLRADPLALASYHAHNGDEVNLLKSIGSNRDESIFVVGSPDSRLPVRSLPGDPERGGYIYEASFAGGFNQLKSLRQADIPSAYAQLSTNVGITTRYGVAVPGGVPASAITGWKKIDVFPGTEAFEVTASSSEITAADREGWSFAGSTTHDWAVFDHYIPRVAGEVLTVEKPSVSVLSRARQHWGVLVFTKQSGWTFFADKQDVLTAAYLDSAGFVRGSWAYVPDLPMWVPRSGEGYTVAVNAGFIPD